MVPIRQKLCDPSMYYLKCPFTTNKEFVVMHNTANSASADNEVSYMIRNGNEISFHAAVDDKEIVQGVPFLRNVWASGDGHGNGNMHGYHIEICYSTHPDESLFKKAEMNGAEYAAYILTSNGWGIDRLKKHQDFDGKYCPHKTLDLGWNRFVNMVQSFMQNKEEEEQMFTYEQFKEYQAKYEKEQIAKEASSWAKEVWEKATAAGLVDGTKPRTALTREQFAMIADRLGYLDGDSKE